MPDTTRLLKLASLALLVLSPAAAHAQSSRSATARADMEMRQRMLWDLDKLKADRQPKQTAVRPTYQEVAEAFKQLQVVNHSLAVLADAKLDLDFARVKKESAELRKQATRLKGYLYLPEAEPDAKQEKPAEIQTPESLRSAVVRLDELVRRFVWNPFFQHPDVVDLEQTTKASHDLVGIIALSEQIRRSADEINKSLAKK